MYKILIGILIAAMVLAVLAVVLFGLAFPMIIQDLRRLAG